MNNQLSTHTQERISYKKMLNLGELGIFKIFPGIRLMLHPFHIIIHCFRNFLNFFGGKKFLIKKWRISRIRGFLKFFPASGRYYIHSVSSYAAPWIFSIFFERKNFRKKNWFCRKLLSVRFGQWTQGQCKPGVNMVTRN